MKMRKEWMYVIALVILVLFIAVIFKDEINFSPVKKNSLLFNNKQANTQDFSAFTQEFGGKTTEQSRSIEEQLKKLVNGASK